MSIRVGQPVPDLVMQAYVRGEEEPRQINLTDLRGQWVVLFFYPRDFTFICPTELEAFGHLQPAFEKEKAVILAASTDSYYSHKAWYESDERLAHVAYPIIADTSHALSKAFNVLLENGDDLRGTFVIDPEGMVRHMSVNDLDVGRNVQEILRTLQALRRGELCPEGWTPDQPTLTEQMEAE